MKRILFFLMAMVAVLLPARGTEKYAFTVNVEPYEPMRVEFLVEYGKIIFYCESLDMKYNLTEIAPTVWYTETLDSENAVVMRGEVSSLQDEIGYNDNGTMGLDLIGNSIYGDKYNPDPKRQVMLAEMQIMVSPIYGGDYLVPMDVVPADHDRFLEFKNKLLGMLKRKTHSESPSSEPAAVHEPQVAATPLRLDIASLIDHRFGLVPLTMEAPEVHRKLIAEGMEPFTGKRPQGESYLDPRMVLQFDQPGSRVENPKRDFWMHKREVVVAGFDGDRPLQCGVYMNENEVPSRWAHLYVSFSYSYLLQYYDQTSQRSAFEKAQKQRATELFRYVTDTFKAHGIALKGNGKKQRAPGCSVEIEHNKDLDQYSVTVHLTRNGAAAWPIPTDIWRY